ncbi:MAG: hypothetical protein HQ589_08940 [Syntrophaceae bacterium]|nr:hypothetical protein [Syntrophaceae bacterium]
MRGENQVILNTDTVMEVLEKHLRSEIFQDGSFEVSAISHDSLYNRFTITLSEKEAADATES